MEQRPLKVPKLAWVEEEEEGLGAAPAEETKEVVRLHAQQEGAALERTQEQDPTRGLFHRTAQFVCKFIKSIRQEEARAMGMGLRAHSEVLKHETSAALLCMLVEEVFYNPQQVPALVRYIHQWLLANDSAEHRLDKPLLDLTEAQPADVVTTLLRVSPLCDRAAMAMWKTIMGSDRTAELAQLILLDVLGSWPEHSTCTSDGDKTGVFALAVLEFLDLREHDADRVLQIFSRYLQSECRERRLLAFKALLKLTDNPLMNNSQVQQLSILLFQTLLTLPLEKKIKALKTQVRHSLLPLFFHYHDENRRVAQLEEDSSSAAEHLRQALPYLQSPQESLRVEAIRFIGEPRAQAPSLARRSSAPAPPAAPAAAPGPSAMEPRLASALLLPSGSRALGRQRAARAWAEPCRTSRACGHSAGSATGRELCRWGCDRLCVHRHRWTELD
ncbi:unnamed protein product [Coccothraustes coccothraustes]